jgi:hypothetical protein
LSLTDAVGEMDASAHTLIADRPHLSLRRALGPLVRCVVRTVGMFARREVTQPTDHLGHVLRFGDGSHGRVYRETAARRAVTDEPVVLVVAFRLRWVGGLGHAVFRAESLLNTPLFVGFPGFVSKLWLAHDEHGVYRGVYQWNGARRADAYVRALWWLLALVSVRSSIRYVVLPGLRRDDVLADQRVLDGATPGDPDPEAWWRLVGVERRNTLIPSGLWSSAPGVEESGCRRHWA